MIRKTISDAVTNIGTRHIEEAADFSVMKKAHKPVWLKWGTIAACFVLVLSISITYIPNIISDWGQKDVVPPLNIIEYNVSYYEVVDMTNTELLDTYNLPHEITADMVGAELGAGLDEQGKQTEELSYLYTPYAEIAPGKGSGGNHRNVCCL